MRGPTEKAAPARSVNRAPHGLDKKTTHPLTKAKGVAGRGANRVLKGVDKKRGKPGALGYKPKSLEGRYF